MPDRLTPRQRELVSRKIRKETRLRNRAVEKRRMGRKLSDIEMRRIARSRSQVIRIGFEEAREQDPTIPEQETRRS